MDQSSKKRKLDPEQGGVGKKARSDDSGVGNFRPGLFEDAELQRNTQSYAHSQP